MRQNRLTVTGAVPANSHEGSRSEVLADYLLSGWGQRLVTPVRQDDYGIDLYCTLTERVERRALVRDYFSESYWKYWIPAFAGMTA